MGAFLNTSSEFYMGKTEHTQGNFRVNEKHVLLDDLQILKDAKLNSSKNPIIAYLKSTDLRVLLLDLPLNYFVLSKKNPR